MKNNRVLYLEGESDEKLVLAEGEHLNLVCIQHNDSKVRLVVDQARDSELHMTTISEGCNADNRIEINLLGADARCTCNGIAIFKDVELVRNKTLINHKARRQTSRELYKYVLSDKATGVFEGKVLVDKGAQKTDSAMRNQNICGSKESRMTSDPMLEIYADDVKCSHGSTTGQMDERALFYMQQRGVSLAVAKGLLQQAFVNEVLEQIPILDVRRQFIDADQEP